MDKEYKIEEKTLDELLVKEPAIPYTYADYLKWTFEERVELIKGKIFNMAPAPNRKHQKIAGKVYHQLANGLSNHSCEAYFAPFDVRLPSKPKDSDASITTVVQPDIVVVCDHEMLDDKGCNGAPDFIIEILSPSTAKKDLTIKHQLYEENKVKEYWIVYPNEELVEVYILEGTKYGRPTKYVNDELVPVNTLIGLSIDLKEVFEGR